MQHSSELVVLDYVFWITADLKQYHYLEQVEKDGIENSQEHCC